MSVTEITDFSPPKFIDSMLLLNILADGMDYVCRGYWGQVEDYTWLWWYAKDETAFDGVNTSLINPEITSDTVLCRIRDDEDELAEEEDRPFVDITLRKLASATAWALSHYSHLFSSVTLEGETIADMDYDAIGEDVIIQKIVLGDVVYG